jgi:hypothetical protein
MMMAWWLGYYLTIKIDRASRIEQGGFATSYIGVAFLIISLLILIPTLKMQQTCWNTFWYDLCMIRGKGLIITRIDFQRLFHFQFKF